MFYHDGGKLRYEVGVDAPNPAFAEALQQAIDDGTSVRHVVTTRTAATPVDSDGNPFDCGLTCARARPGVR